MIDAPSGLSVQGFALLAVLEWAMENAQLIKNFANAENGSHEKTGSEEDYR